MKINQNNCIIFINTSYVFIMNKNKQFYKIKIILS